MEVGIGPGNRLWDSDISVSFVLMLSLFGRFPVSLSCYRLLFSIYNTDSIEEEGNTRCRHEGELWRPSMMRMDRVWLLQIVEKGMLPDRQM